MILQHRKQMQCRWWQPEGENEPNPINMRMVEKRAVQLWEMAHKLGQAFAIDLDVTLDVPQQYTPGSKEWYQNMYLTWKPLPPLNGDSK